ncbi:hypothetical protein FRX31_004454 [Thalictrum thalictroides]|uniref:RNase H type-1 domain-containing protein n=1 Tax=Thalictrum thalictroides TaxID=46969 RepID=A0A7J6XAJ1_THATH|nr:hypothetical protein FRX31_004454 [Thalictrum thalictroides]
MVHFQYREQGRIGKCQGDEEFKLRTTPGQRQYEANGKYPSVLSVNTDGSITTTKVGYGGIFRDYLGRPTFAYCGGAAEDTITAIEVEDITVGLELAIQMGYNKVCVGSDSMQTIDSIKGKTQPTWRAKYMVARTRRAMNNLEMVESEHIVRETNMCADFLSKLCFSGDSLKVFMSPFCEQLVNFVNQDAVGILYSRM